MEFENIIFQESVKHEFVQQLLSILEELSLLNTIKGNCYQSLTCPN